MIRIEEPLDEVPAESEFVGEKPFVDESLHLYGRRTLISVNDHGKTVSAQIFRSPDGRFQVMAMVDGKKYVASDRQYPKNALDNLCELLAQKNKGKYLID